MKELANTRKQERINKTRGLAIWTFTWVGSVALVTFGPLFLWDSDALLTSLALILNVIIGFGMIRANIRYLKGLDELEQKIQMDAMGFTLGITLVAGMAYSMMDSTNLITKDAEISILVIIMAITYMAAIVYGKIRYQ